MGRTKRKRVRKNGHFSAICLDNDASIVALNQWMKANNWKNISSLRMSHFRDTARGLTSPKQIFEMDTLIEVPYELMITFTSLEDSFLNNAFAGNMSVKLKMIDILSIYLTFERHKGNKSKWKTYIDSLPNTAPHLPWLCFPEEISKIPQELQAEISKRFDIFNSSWKRSNESIHPRWKCECCGTPGHCVLTLNSFTWAYAMVNTRAVYLDPNIVRGLSRCGSNLSCVLSDDPCMALCPYLDMFNHSSKVKTSAKLEKVNANWTFRLITLTPSDKYKEIFISYGFHNNVKLLCEYGFFITDDELDTIVFDFNEVLKCTKLSVNKKQYNFIHEKHLNRELNISTSGISFNLKAVLFIILNYSLSDWCFNVFSETYLKEDLLRIYSSAKHLIEVKIETCSSEFYDLNENPQTSSEPFKNVLSYLQYRIGLMTKMYNNISKDML